MRKRFYHVRVCSCSPDNGVTYLNARLLRVIVNSTIHPIRCARNSAWMAQRGLMLGDLCAEARHPMWALKVWRFALSQIHAKDYDEWIDVWFNTKYVRLGDVIADGWCEVIGRRMDETERRLGLSDAHGRDSWEYRAGDGWYDSFYSEKYDADWDEWRDYYVALRDGAVGRQQTARLFDEAQPDGAPCPQDFFGYWNGDGEAQEDYYFKIDDWDES